jgi:hypothetical protein
MQFRLRAAPDSPMVLPAIERSKLETGSFVVRRQDAPLFVVRACADAGSILCTDRLETGDKVERRDLLVRTAWW